MHLPIAETLKLGVYVLDTFFQSVRFQLHPAAVPYIEQAMPSPETGQEPHHAGDVGT